jgi:hypothetical protein
MIIVLRLVSWQTAQSIARAVMGMFRGPGSARSGQPQAALPRMITTTTSGLLASNGFFYPRAGSHQSQGCGATSPVQARNLLHAPLNRDGFLAARFRAPPEAFVSEGPCSVLTGAHWRRRGKLPGARKARFYTFPLARSVLITPEPFVY